MMTPLTVDGNAIVPVSYTDCADGIPPPLLLLLGPLVFMPCAFTLAKPFDPINRATVMAATNKEGIIVLIFIFITSISHFNLN